MMFDFPGPPHVVFDRAPWLDPESDEVRLNCLLTAVRAKRDCPFVLRIERDTLSGIARKHPLSRQEAIEVFQDYFLRSIKPVAMQKIRAGDFEEDDSIFIRSSDLDMARDPHSKNGVRK